MTHAVLPFPFEPDKTLVDGRFLVKGELGQGGMGRCYRVWQESLDRLCVLKMLAPKLHPRFFAHQDARVLLENEAKTLGQLGIGNEFFVQVFDRGVLYILVRQDGEVFELDLPYYVMDFLHGFSLEVLIDTRQQMRELVPWNDVLSLCAQMARALGVAHERAVIHRDFKPDNIFLHMRFDSGFIVKLIDFGVSTREGAPSLFGTGTARYGAPEILSRSAARESTQSDMYPLGLVFFELAALRGPFIGHGKADYMRAHVHEPPPRLSELRADCPPFFDAITARLLSKDPEARPTAKEVAAELEAEVARRGSAKETGAALTHLLQSIGRRAGRQGVASRALSVGRTGRAATTASVESLVEGAAKRSTLYLTQASPLVAADRRTMPFGAAPPARSSAMAPKATSIPLGSGLPAVAVSEPIIVDRTESAGAGGSRGPVFSGPAGDTTPDAALVSGLAGDTIPDAPPLVEAPAGDIADVADVPVFRSMAHVFEAAWEGDNVYAPSPLSTTEAPVGPRPSSSLSAIVASTAGRPSRTPSGAERAAARRRPDVAKMGYLAAGAASLAVVIAVAMTWAASKNRGSYPTSAVAASAMPLPQAAAPRALETAAQPTPIGQPSALVAPSAEAPPLVAAAARPPAPQAATATSAPAPPSRVKSTSRPAAAHPKGDLAPWSEDRWETRFDDTPLSAQASATTSPSASAPIFGDWLAKPTDAGAGSGRSPKQGR